MAMAMATKTTFSWKIQEHVHVCSSDRLAALVTRSLWRPLNVCQAGLTRATVALRQPRTVLRAPTMTARRAFVAAQANKSDAATGASAILEWTTVTVAMWRAASRPRRRIVRPGTPRRLVCAAARTRRIVRREAYSPTPRALARVVLRKSAAAETAATKTRRFVAVTSAATQVMTIVTMELYTAVQKC